MRKKYSDFARQLPDTRIFYAVKANPSPEILSLLVELGACFDTASIEEIKICLAAGATADRISYGNTIKKESDIQEAYRLGVRLYAFDSEAELNKLARSAPGSKVMCRMLCDGSGAEWPLSRKFGCDKAMTEALLEDALTKGLEPVGVSFHVGSQQTDPASWNKALASVASVFKNLAEKGVFLTLVNLGGGFPARYVKDVPSCETYSDAIKTSLRKHFGNKIPETLIEPGRGLVGDAGFIEAEVVLISQKSAKETMRWVYLDIGKFSGLAETEDEAIRYPIRTPHDRDEKAPCVLAGPTCDSVDVLYEKTPYPLPITLEIGDKVLIGSTGAYTTTYSSVAFNGFPPLRSYCI